MANELATARTGLVTRLATITGLRVYKYPSLPMVEFPCAVIYLDRGPVKTAISGNSFAARFRVRVYVQHGDDVDGFTDLDKFLEQVGATTSIIGAIEADRSLNNSVDWARIAEQPSGITKVTGTEEAMGYYTADWLIDVAKQVA